MLSKVFKGVSFMRRYWFKIFKKKKKKMVELKCKSITTKNWVGGADSTSILIFVFIFIMNMNIFILPV